MSATGGSRCSYYNPFVIGLRVIKVNASLSLNCIVRCVRTPNSVVDGRVAIIVLEGDRVGSTIREHLGLTRSAFIKPRDVECSRGRYADLHDFVEALRRRAING